MNFSVVIILIGVLLLAGVLANKVAAKFGLPALVLFLVVGMLAGSEGLGGIYFNNPELTGAVGDSALILILFAGGLDTEWRRVRPVLGIGLTLSTLGVALTALLVGTFAWFMLGTFSNFDLGTTGLSWTEGLLLGTIVSSTDAAAVFSILRSSGLKLQGELQPLLEFESGSNDPMAVLLTTNVVQILTTDHFSMAALMGALVQQLLIGGLVGYGAGRAMVWVVNHIRLRVPSLYPITTFALLLITYGLTDRLGGNGFLAVYIAGMVLGNMSIVQRELILSFHDGLNWLMSIAMFLVLGLLVFPSQLPSIAGVGLAIALFLMFVARPISVFICLTPFAMPWAEKSFLAWVGLRGAVPIVLATVPLTAGIDGGQQIFNVVFFTVLVSVLVQGLSLAWAAKRLGLTETGA
ncbi:MAG: potassium/proton antiporter [Cyanobacteria bacterium J06638_6]